MQFPRVDLEAYLLFRPLVIHRLYTVLRPLTLVNLFLITRLLRLESVVVVEADVAVPLDVVLFLFCLVSLLRFIVSTS